jgi:long-chain acyl-CoA synthetase
MINNLYEFYKEKCELYSDKILFDNKITYAEAFKLAEQRAVFLQSEGYKKGDVIAILAKSNAEWVLSYMAINMLGGVVLPLDVNLMPQALTDMAKNLKAKALFISDEYKGVIKKIKTYPVSLEKSLEKKKKFKVPKVSEDDTATFIYTSGTTGTPKIVALTHRNIFCTAENIGERARMTTSDLFLCLLPLYHVYALLACFAGPFSHGAAFVYLTSLKGPDIMKCLAENPFTVFPAAPLLWEMIMDGIIKKVKGESAFKYRLFKFFLEYGTAMRKIGLSFLPIKFLTRSCTIRKKIRFFVSGGAPLKDKYRKYYKSMGFTVLEGYGLTETTGPITLPDPDKNFIGSVGPVISGNESKIKNINDEGIGEVWLKGDSVTPGYYNNAAANKEVFDNEGFFNTGDLGKKDKHGNIYLTGRVKNVIVISSGKNVYPEELETYYKKSEEIEEIAVFGLDKDGDEHVYAVIVPKDKTEKSFEKIKNELTRLNKGLPSYKTVTDFAISFDKLPVNSARKVVYRTVIDLLKQGVYMEHENDSTVLRDVLTPTTPYETEVIETLRKKLKVKTIYAKQTFADFKIDSLGLVDLTVQLEEALSISIDLEKFKTLQTMDEIVAYLVSLEKTSGGSIKERLFEGEITEKPLLFFNPVLYFWIALIKLCCKVFWKVKVINPEKFEINNCIILANHSSYFDIPWLISAMKIRDIKNTYAIGKKEVSGIRYVFHGMPVIWIDYDKNTNEVFKKSADLLRQNKSVMIFPEGIRSANGEMQEFKLGSAYLAKNINREIIPVTINGTYDIWPPEKKFPEFVTKKRGSVVIHDKINPADYKTIESLMAKVRSEIEKGIDPVLNKK